MNAVTKLAVCTLIGYGMTVTAIGGGRYRVTCKDVVALNYASARELCVFIDGLRSGIAIQKERAR